MKNTTLKTTICIALLLFTTLANAQKHQMDSLLTILDKSIASLETLSAFPFKIELTAGDSDKKFDEKDDSNFDENSGRKSMESIKKFFESLPIYQGINYPYNFIEFKYYESGFANDYLGFDHFYFDKHKDQIPEIIFNKVNYIDGTSELLSNNYISEYTIAHKNTKTEVEDGTSYNYVDTESMTEEEKIVWENKSAFSKSFMLLNPKLVKDIDATILVKLTKQESYTLDAKNNVVETPFGKITLQAISANKIAISIPYAIKEKHTITALYKDKRALKEKSSNSSSGLSEEDVVYYEKVKSALEDARRLIKKNKIKTLADWEKWVEENMPKPENSKTKMVEYNYSFSGPVSSFVVSVQDTSIQTETFKTNYKIYYNERYGDQKYAVVSDFKTKKNGIINASGNWIIKPNYSQYFRQINDYFYCDQIDEYEATYWLNPKTLALQKANYRIDDPEVFDGKYIKIEPKVNGKNGLVNVETGEIVLPMIYGKIHFEENKFWEARLEGKTGLLDRNFKIIIPYNEHQRFQYNGDFIYTSWETEGQIPHWHYDVYNLQGENITKGRFQEIDGEFENGYMLVQTHDQKRKPEGGYETINNQYFIINEKGAVVLKVNAEKYYYISADNLKNKTLLVRSQKTDKYGYIDMNGAEFIACQYDYVKPFFSKYTLVEQNDIYMLIDKQNKIIKKFSSKVNEIYKNESTNLYNFNLYNGEIYDEFGVFISKGAE